MSKVILLFLLLVFACKKDQTNKPSNYLKKDSITNLKCEIRDGRPVIIEKLSFLDEYQNLTLFQLNSKCGEFGGDIKELKFYKDSLASSIFVDFKKSIMDCDSDPHPNEAKIVVSKKVLNQNEIELLSESIKQLINFKINSNKQTAVHRGILNFIVSKDSSFYINDYPSFEWSKFIELSKLIENKKHHSNK